MRVQIKFKVGGVEFSLSKEDVEQKLQAVKPEDVREVAVTVNGNRYPVKQALAEATGLLRGDFNTHTAMNVFRRLSFPVSAEPISLLGGTEELICPKCSKPYTFKRLSQAQFALEGCSCETPAEAIEIPMGAVLTNLGGLLVVRVPKRG
jgi:hypothetical protein